MSTSLISLEAAALGPFHFNLEGPCSLRRAALDHVEFSNNMLQSFVSACLALESLSLSFANISMPPCSESLLTLEMSATPLSDEGLSMLEKWCPRLRVLLARKCHSLRNVELGGNCLRLACFCLSENLETLMLKCPQLAILDVGNCSNIQRLDVDACHCLREVNIYLTRDGMQFDPSPGTTMSRDYYRRQRSTMESLRATLEERNVLVSATASAHLTQWGMGNVRVVDS